MAISLARQFQQSQVCSDLRGRRGCPSTRTVRNSRPSGSSQRQRDTASRSMRSGRRRRSSRPRGEETTFEVLKRAAGAKRRCASRTRNAAAPRKRGRVRAIVAAFAASRSSETQGGTGPRSRALLDKSDGVCLSRRNRAHPVPETGPLRRRLRACWHRQGWGCFRGS
jgi:hypothetical protein